MENRLVKASMIEVILERIELCEEGDCENSNSSLGWKRNAGVVELYIHAIYCSFALVYEVGPVPSMSAKMASYNRDNKLDHYGGCISNPAACTLTIVECQI